MSETRPRQELTQNSGRDRDKTESPGAFFYETETRTNLIMKKTVNLARICLITSHPDQDETRLSKIEANKMRPGQYCVCVCMVVRAGMCRAGDKCDVDCPAC